jgi:hypothetical protein
MCDLYVCSYQIVGSVNSLINFLSRALQKDDDDYYWDYLFGIRVFCNWSSLDFSAPINNRQLYMDPVPKNPEKWAVPVGSLTAFDPKKTNNSRSLFQLV